MISPRSNDDTDSDGFIATIPVTATKPTLRDTMRRLAGKRVPLLGCTAWPLLLFLVFETLVLLWAANRYTVKDAPKFARAASSASLVHLGAVLLPATRRSVMLYLFRIPFQLAVRLHRWIGVAALLWILAHGAAMSLEYGVAAMFAKASPTGRPHAPIYGSLGGIGFLVILILASPWVRRRSFELFYFSHHVLVVPVALAVLHVRPLLLYGTAAVVLLLIDKFLRFVRGRRTWTLVGVGCSPPPLAGDIDGHQPPPQGPRYVRVDLRRGSDTGDCAPWPPGSFCFVNVTAASALQWHPASPFPTAAGTGTGSSRELSVVFKVIESAAAAAAAAATKQRTHASPAPTTALSWTGTVAALAHGFRGETGASLGTISLDGPYGGYRGVLGSPVTIMIVGGVGITPMLSALADLARDPAPRVAVLVVWCIRTIELVKLVDRELTMILDDPRVRMQVHLTRGTELGTIDSNSNLRNLCASGRASFEMGRPNIGAQVSAFLEDGIRVSSPPRQLQASLSCMMCGPAGLVRDAQRQVPDVASRLGWNVEMHAEEFEF
jgi:predicted ferric reductase